MSLNIRIVDIPHSDQRYATVGDWQWTSPGNLFITVSNMGDWRKEALVAIHELVEVLLCRNNNISQEEVDEFDKLFEEARIDNNFDEPGDSPLAPYRNEHFFATNIERLLARELNVDWSNYEKVINSL